LKKAGDRDWQTHGGNEKWMHGQGECAGMESGPREHAVCVLLAWSTIDCLHHF
jgi:hypothetical protein